MSHPKDIFMRFSKEAVQIIGSTLHDQTVLNLVISQSLEEEEELGLRVGMYVWGGNEK